MPATASSQVLTSVRTVGGLLPADMLIRIAEGKDVSGSRPADYHVVGVRSVQDAAERHWDFLKGAWRALRDAIGDAGHDPSGLAVENWLLPLFEEHGFGRLERIPAGIQSTDRAATFPVTHRWRHVPIHLVGWDTDLDHRVPGGGLPPQSMLQECLNRSDEHLWGRPVQRPAAPAAAGLLLAGGRRVHRDRPGGDVRRGAVRRVRLALPASARLPFRGSGRRRAVGLLAGEVARSRRSRPGRVPWISSATAWRTAIAHLGTGFLRHPANHRLREDLDTDLFKRALLRLVYRLLFWFVAEDRDVLLHPDADQTARTGTRSTTPRRRLRASALRRIGTSHGDLWRAVRLVLNALGDEDGLPRLGLAGLGGIYDDTGTDQILRGLELSNEHLLAAVKSLARVYDKSARRWRRVDYQNLGAEELGSIYESLLELVPKWSKEKREFLLDVMPGNERKSTGSYYTPTSLIDCLLDSTLDPVLDDAQKRAEVAATNAGTDPSLAIADALLAVTVCDPACGSGHFLVAAARRIAKRLAAVREHNPEPTVEALRTALRDVVKHCIYGVDVNPMAVELAKVSLWLEALEPGKPLGFLDAHIKCGNALIGATPALDRPGHPGQGVQARRGRRPAVGCVPRSGRTPTTDPGKTSSSATASSSRSPTRTSPPNSPRSPTAPDGSLRDVHRQAAAYRDWEQSPENEHNHQVADAWCAAFVWHQDQGRAPRHRQPGLPRAARAGHRRRSPRHRHRDRQAQGRVRLLPLAPGVPRHLPRSRRCRPSSGPGHRLVRRLHLPPRQPAVGQGRLRGQEVLQQGRTVHRRARRADTARPASPSGSERTRSEAARYRAARRKVKSTFLFASSSEAFPLCAKGLTVKGVNSLQTDQLFAERFATIAAPVGRIGCIIPTAIATGAGGQYLFRDFTERGAVASLYDFENRKPLFVGVHCRPQVLPALPDR